MNAEDTVTTEDVVHDSVKGLSWATLIDDCINEEMVKPYDVEQYILDLLLDNRKAQAEITWKAGIDTLWKEIQKLGYQRVLDDLVIMGKLKEWGIE